MRNQINAGDKRGIEMQKDVENEGPNNLRDN